jgi:hypothetical protein
MIGLSNLVIELTTSGMFSSVESVDYHSISKDHLGDIEVTFNDQRIRVQVYSGDDFESIGKKIIDKAKFD